MESFFYMKFNIENEKYGVTNFVADFYRYK